MQKEEQHFVNELNKLRLKQVYNASKKKYLIFSQIFEFC